MRGDSCSQIGSRLGKSWRRSLALQVTLIGRCALPGRPRDNKHGLAHDAGIAPFTLFGLQVLQVLLVGTHQPVPKNEKAAEIAQVVGMVIVMRRRTVHPRDEREGRDREGQVVARVRINRLPELESRVHPEDRHMRAEEERPSDGRQRVADEVLDGMCVPECVMKQRPC